MQLKQGGHLPDDIHDHQQILQSVRSKFTYPAFEERSSIIPVEMFVSGRKRVSQ